MEGALSALLEGTLTLNGEIAARQNPNLEWRTSTKSPPQKFLFLKRSADFLAQFCEPIEADFDQVRVDDSHRTPQMLPCLTKAQAHVARQGVAGDYPKPASAKCGSALETLQSQDFQLGEFPFNGSSWILN